jgi:hypothetical protein
MKLSVEIKGRKIFVLGPNKCGTLSLHKYFLRNKLKSVHWDHGELAIRIASNISANRLPLEGYEEYDCFSDLYFLDDRLYISPLLLGKEIVKRYPEDIFILNVRDFQMWQESRNNHASGSISTRLNSVFGAKYNAADEHEAYSELLNYGVKRLHIFQLDDTYKFKKLSAFLKQEGINIIDEGELKANVTNGSAEAG